MKAAGFDTTFTNALGNKNIGGAYGGADFDPYNKSETEIQVWICVCVLVLVRGRMWLFSFLSVFSVALSLLFFLPFSFSRSLSFFLSFPSLLSLLSLTPHSFHSLYCDCIPSLILPPSLYSTLRYSPFILFQHTFNFSNVRTYARTQRFCQSYMTELSKYIGPDIDLPGLGNGVNAPEIG